MPFACSCPAEIVGDNQAELSQKALRPRCWEDNVLRSPRGSRPRGPAGRPGGASSRGRATANAGAATDGLVAPTKDATIDSPYVDYSTAQLSFADVPMLLLPSKVATAPPNFRWLLAGLQAI